MPGENVSFIAYGQDHTDEAAMLAVQEQLVTLHQELQAKGQQLVIGIEHSEHDVKNTSGIREMHNQAVMQIYLEKTANPSYADFLTTCGDQLITKEKYPDVRGYTETAEWKIQELFEKQSKVWTHDVNKGKGEARLVEAATLDWANLNKIPVRGLDPVTDSDKSARLTDGSGKIDGAALSAMEYERVQGMGRKSAEVMQELSAGEGGCLVAINMGTAHLCSLEVSLRENLESQGLKDASISVDALVPPDRLLHSPSLDHAARDMMHSSVTDMQNASPDAKLAASALARLNMVDTEMRRLVPIRGAMESLPKDEEEFRKMLKEDPQKMVDALKSAGLPEKAIGKVTSRTNEKLSKPEGYSKSAREFVMMNFGVRDEDMRIQSDSVAEEKQKFETALTSLKSGEQEAFRFAMKVDDRLNNRPGEVFKALTPGPDGSYNLQQSGPVHTTSTRDSLSVASSSSSSAPSHHLEQGGSDVGPSTSSSSDNSTRAHFKRSGSLSSLGGDTTTTLGTSPPKVHAFK